MYIPYTFTHINEICQPTAVSSLKAAMPHKDKTVTLTWTNPALDTNGIATNEPMSVEVAPGHTVYATLDAQKPGSETSCTVSRDNFTGTPARTAPKRHPHRVGRGGKAMTVPWNEKH